MTALDRSRLPQSVDRQLSVLVEGDFLERRENVLVFGNPGSGKTHLVCGLDQELILRGRSVYFTSWDLLVQRLLRAKSELWLEKELKRLDKFLALITDDLGYVQQSREEMEVLFTLLAHRYEHCSVLVTSNLVFSDWERIFKDPMALWQREEPTPMILHSDRGCQFTSEEYQRFLRSHHLICSMSAAGSCADNAPAESFFALLKRERVNRRQYRTRSEARADIFDYIERFYNPRKRQQLGMIQQKDLLLTQPSAKSE